MDKYVRLSVCHTFSTMFASSYHHEIFRSYYQWPKEAPYKRSRSEVKGQGHRGQNPTKLFPDRNSSLNLHMVMKWCTKLGVAYERCRIVFSGWSIKFQGNETKKIVDFDPNWAFRTVTPDWMHQWLRNDAQTWSSIEEVSYCFSRSSVKFQGHTGQ